MRGGLIYRKNGLFHPKAVKLEEIEIGKSFRLVGKETILVKISDTLVEWDDMFYVADPDLLVVPVTPAEHSKSIQEEVA